MKFPLPIFKYSPEVSFPKFLQREVLEFFIWIACSQFPFTRSLKFECVLEGNAGPSGRKTSLSRYAMYCPQPREPLNFTGSGKLPHVSFESGFNRIECYCVQPPSTYSMSI